MKAIQDLPENTTRLQAAVHRDPVLHKAHRHGKIPLIEDLPVHEAEVGQKLQNQDHPDPLNQVKAGVQEVVMSLLPGVRLQVLPTALTIREAAEAVLQGVDTSLRLPGVHHPVLLQDLLQAAVVPVVEVAVAQEEAEANSPAISQ